MPMEDDLKENTAALREMTKALLGQKAGAAATTGAAGGTTGAKTPTHTLEEVTEKAVAVKAAKGEDVAKALIKDVGKAKSLKEMKPAQYDALYDACEAKLNEGDEL